MFPQGGRESTVIQSLIQVGTLLDFGGCGSLLWHSFFIWDRNTNNILRNNGELVSDPDADRGYRGAGKPETPQFLLVWMLLKRLIL